jgi:hypothetical protein
VLLEALQGLITATPAVYRSGAETEAEREVPAYGTSSVDRPPDFAQEKVNQVPDRNRSVA